MTKLQREQVRAKFGGRCAYCGHPLGQRWHVDHLDPVCRRSWLGGGCMERPWNDSLANMMPACVPCNLDKHARSLEDWRGKLERSTAVLARNSTTYRHAMRFGLVVDTGAAVVFHFERMRKAVLPEDN